MPGGITRSAFQRFFFPGLNEVIGMKYREKEAQFEKIYNVLGSDGAFEEDIQMAGLNLFVRMDEEQEFPADQWKSGWSIRYDMVKWGLRVGFSDEFLADSKVQVQRDRASDLGKSARETVEVLVADDFNNGFSGNTGYGVTSEYDGVSLFNSAHPMIKGGGSGGQTQSNVLATAATLSVSSYRDMLTLSRLMFDETGVRRIQLSMRDLVVPPQLEFVAKEIVKSAGRPDTANRADNVTRDATGIVIWDYLLNAKYWFMVSAKSDHKLKFYWRDRFTTRPSYNEDAEVHWIRGRMRFSHGYSDYIGTFGTNPT
jgi:hypothetical protein